MTTQANLNAVNELEAYFLRRNDIINRYGNMVSHYQALPGLIGLWYGGRYQRSTGNLPNLANVYGTTNKQDLAYNGNPTFNYLDNGIGYAALDGTGDYFSVADNTDLDILGTESFVSNPGLTMGGWFYLTDNTSEALISKFGSVGDFTYRLIVVGPSVFFQVSTDGTNVVSASNSVALNTWYYIWASFNPSTRMTMGVNGDINETTVGVPASIFNGSAALCIGAGVNGTLNLLNGRFSVAFVCASYLTDAIGQSLFQQTRSLYGV